MNKFKFILLAAMVVMGAGQVQAQQKVGYISVEQVVSLMPELGKIDTLLQRFQADSLNAEFATLIQDYNYRDSMLTKTDTSKMPATVKREHRQQMENDAYQIQNWQQISQNVMQAKQQELLAPVYDKVRNAINQVAKESGYAYVMNMEALLVGPPADNLLQPVARKLNIKLPTQAAPGQQQRPPAGGAAPRRGN